MASFGSYAVGQILTAAELNAEGAWTTDTTPSVTNITKGNATTWYMKRYKFNKIGIISVNLTFGSTSDVTGDATINLPSGWTSSNNGAGGIAVVQANGTVYPSYWRISTAGTSILVRAINAASTYALSTLFGTAIPGGDWISGDFIRFTGIIELD